MKSYKKKKVEDISVEDCYNTIISRSKALKTIASLFAGFSFTAILFFLNPNSKQFLSETRPILGKDVFVFTFPITFIIVCLFMFLASAMLLAWTEIKMGILDRKKLEENEETLQRYLKYSEFGKYLLEGGIIYWIMSVFVFFYYSLNQNLVIIIVWILFLFIILPLFFYFIDFIRERYIKNG